MALKEDIEKFKNSWESLSIEWKVILTIMTLIQILTIGSIGDAVYNFKGFLVYGVEFYQTLTDPIFNYLLTYLNLELLNREIIDTITWGVLYFGTLWRVLKSSDNSNYLWRGISIAVVLVVCMAFYDNIQKYQLPQLAFGGAIGSLSALSFVSKSWIPLSIFIVPVIAVAFLAGVSEGIMRA